MHNTTEPQRVTLRLDAALVDDLDRLVHQLGDAAPGLYVSRANVVRLLLRRALSAGEAVTVGFAELAGAHPTH